MYLIIGYLLFKGGGGWGVRGNELIIRFVFNFDI